MRPDALCGVPRFWRLPACVIRMDSPGLGARTGRWERGVQAKVAPLAAFARTADCHRFVSPLPCP